ncbi:succinylglutamate desuccinylase/aspartoacylase family protein [Marinobacterium aestuariivivens]|uniref:Succinylglutamate desuccinylase/aspartoacylase family protein n=1 Tax=Marinobacterium aestuariivivens TaxID=1698799 RepID=A0ABW2A8P6_9GAMM
MPQAITIGGQEIAAGSRVMLELPLPHLYTHTPMTMPVQVVRGRKDGPSLFVSAAIHGDELNGIEIIRRLLKYGGLRRLKGTLITIPIVNVYGVIHHSRYLPDRRDLNRAFPGSERGSMTGRLADIFMREIVGNATHGIDLHTGAINRVNLPQIRANLDDRETARLAHAFGVPVVMNANLRDGSLRQAADELGIPMLLYEAGEALRFDELSIRAGLKGIINVMRELGMLPSSRRRGTPRPEPFFARSSTWVRAPSSGIFRTLCALGNWVKKGEVMGMISDPLGDSDVEVRAGCSGILVGRTNIPLVHEGEALFHIARYEDEQGMAERVESFQEEGLEFSGSDLEPPIV